MRHCSLVWTNRRKNANVVVSQTSAAFNRTSASKRLPTAQSPWRQFLLSNRRTSWALALLNAAVYSHIITHWERQTVNFLCFPVNLVLLRHYEEIEILGGFTQYQHGWFPLVSFFLFSICIQYWLIFPNVKLILLQNLKIGLFTSCTTQIWEFKYRMNHFSNEKWHPQMYFTI